VGDILLRICVRLGNGVYVAVAVNSWLSHAVSRLVPLCFAATATFLLLDLFGGLWDCQLALSGTVCGLCGSCPAVVSARHVVDGCRR
jgi:hypothetical protein